MVLDATHHPEAEAEPEEERRPSAIDPVTLARRMSAAAHRMVRQALEDDEDPFDDELGLRDLHKPTGED